jgi:hypothetical protein
VDYKKYLGGWFQGADLKTIKRGNIEEFVAYGFCYKSRCVCAVIQASGQRVKSPCTCVASCTTSCPVLEHLASTCTCSQQALQSCTCTLRSDSYRQAPRTMCIINLDDNQTPKCWLLWCCA